MNIDQILAEVAEKFSLQLDQPDERVLAFEQKISDLEPLLGRKALKEQWKAAEALHQRLRLVRLKELQDALVIALRPLGCNLQSGKPHPRRRAKPAASTAEPVSAPSTETSSNAAPLAEEASTLPTPENGASASGNQASPSRWGGE